MYSTHQIKRVAAALAVGLLLTVAFAASAQAGSSPKGLTAQQLKAEKARSEAWNRYYGIGSSSVRQAEERRAQAMNQFYKLGAFSPSVAAAQQAEERRSQAMNRFYHLGDYSPAVAAARQAEKRRSQATNRFYHLGQYAVIRESTGFKWSDAGIGAGAMLGAILLVGGLGVAARRRVSAKPSVPTTT